MKESWGTVARVAQTWNGGDRGFRLWSSQLPMILPCIRVLGPHPTSIVHLQAWFYPTFVVNDNLDGAGSLLTLVFPHSFAEAMLDSQALGHTRGSHWPQLVTDLTGKLLCQAGDWAAELTCRHSAFAASPSRLIEVMFFAFPSSLLLSLPLSFPQHPWILQKFFEGTFPAPAFDSLSCWDGICHF